MDFPGIHLHSLHRQKKWVKHGVKRWNTCPKSLHNVGCLTKHELFIKFNGHQFRLLVFVPGDEIKVKMSRPQCSHGEQLDNTAFCSSGTPHWASLACSGEAVQTHAPAAEQIGSQVRHNKRSQLEMSGASMVSLYAWCCVESKDMTSCSSYYNLIPSLHGLIQLPSAGTSPALNSARLSVQLCPTLPSWEINPVGSYFSSSLLQ